MKEFLCLIVVVIFFIYIIDYSKHGTEIENNFLKELTINEKHFVIVDYNILQCSYVLDNGVQVDRGAVKRLLGENYGK